MRVTVPVERPLTRANIDPNIWIKESDVNDFHVEITRRTFIPGKPDSPIYNKFVQCFTQAEWSRLQKLDGSNGVDWQKAALVFSYRIVHNPLKKA